MWAYSIYTPRNFQIPQDGCIPFIQICWLWWCLKNRLIVDTSISICQICWALWLSSYLFFVSSPYETKKTSYEAVNFELCSCSQPTPNMPSLIGEVFLQLIAMHRLHHREIDTPGSEVVGSSVLLPLQQQLVGIRPGKLSHNNMCGQQGDWGVGHDHMTGGISTSIHQRFDGNII